MTEERYRWVPLSDEVFIAAEPTEGVHFTSAFLDGGRYLHTGRAIARVD